MATFFNGRRVVTPATMSVIDDSAMFNSNLSVGNSLAIIGKAEGGEPFKALRFGSPDEARAVLKGGIAMKAIERAFDPSTETAGPATVIFIRVNPATQSTRTLNDEIGQAAVELKSQEFGQFTKNIRIKVEDGSSAGKKITTYYGNDYYTIDNLERKAFTVTYSGEEETATILVENTKVTLSWGVSETEVISLSEFKRIGDLVDKINSIPGFEADAESGSTEKMALNGLDGLDATSLVGNEVSVTGNLQAVIDWINSTGEGFITAVRPATAKAPPANIAAAYLTGGSDGVTTIAEWQKGFNALQSTDVQWVVPLSTEPSIHAMADSHVVYMSDIARNERRSIVGGDIGASDEDAIKAAKALNSDRTSYTHLGFYDYDEDGELALFPPYVLAAQLAGGFSGVNPGTPLTNHTIKIRGIERALKNPTDTDVLIDRGVLCIEDTKEGYKVVKSISTWLVNDNYNRVEVSTGVACDFVSRNVRDAVNGIRGKKSSPFLLTEAINRAESTLQELAKPEPAGPMVIVGDAKNPAYKNLKASVDGDVVAVEFQCSPVIPANYVTIVVHAVPYSGTATA
jgi:hypothetical protein